MNFFNNPICQVFQGMIAVAEKGDSPKVLIYNYPSDVPFKRLERGTLKQYAALAFNREGSQLATVGGDPDYMLTIWDWSNEKILLRTKAFGQDVFNVSFSNYTEGILTTSGVGHIKFWKMAQTFTGLKLQGQIGKFGKVDISDIPAYFEFPDGKVLSASEKGDLLLWEGNLIKCVFVQPENKKCHQGSVEVLQVDSEYIISAGTDGFVRYWSYEALESAEPNDQNNVIEMAPLFEVFIADGVRVRCI